MFDKCPECWTALTRTRWKIASGTRDVQELRQYLGRSFQDGVDSSWALAEEWLREPRTSRDAVESFYKETPWYVYNLVIWNASHQRPLYVKMAAEIIETHSIKSVLDFGAGVGTDSLELAELGLNVTACDFDNEASRFLRWRAKRRGLDIRFVDAATAEQILHKPVDMLWLMDVLEHLLEPRVSLRWAADLSWVVVHDTEHAGTSNGRHPFHFMHEDAVIREMWASWGFREHGSCGGRTGLSVWRRIACRDTAAVVRCEHGVVSA